MSTDRVKAKDTIKIDQKFFEETENTRIIWLGGAGFLINSRGTILLIDPVLMSRDGYENISETGLKMLVSYPIKATEIPKVDVVLYTHPDNDHLGQVTAPILAKLNPRLIGPKSVLKQLTAMGVAVRDFETCLSGDVIRINSVKVDDTSKINNEAKIEDTAITDYKAKINDVTEIIIEVTPADHPWQLMDIEQYGEPFKKEDCCGFIITTPDGRCFFPGDTRLMEEHLLIQNIDLLALDVTRDPYHLDLSGAIMLANSMPEAQLVPIHYGIYDAPDILAQNGNPKDVIDKVRNGTGRVKILAPGEVLMLIKKSKK